MVDSRRGPVDGESSPAAIACPACSAAFAGKPVCPTCGFDPRGTALFDPRHFVWQAMVLSFLAPAWLAGLNQGRLGDRRGMWTWIVVGAVALIGFLVLLSILPTRVMGLVHAGILGWLVNAPIGYLILARQKATFAAHRAAGGLAASTVRGTLIGLGGFILAFVPAMFIAQAVSPDPAIQGVRQLNDGHCVEAERSFRMALHANPDDHDSRYNLALAFACQARSEDAKGEMLRYLAVRPEDATAHAWMAMLYEWEGEREKAQEHARIADSLEPGILQRLFGEEGDLVP